MHKLGHVSIAVIIACSACKSNDDNGNDDACEGMVVAVCENACRCAGADGTCMYYLEIDDESFSSEGEDEENCILVDTLFYCDGTQDMNFDACAEEVDSAACGTYDGMDGLRLPQSCAALGGMETSDTGSSENAPADCQEIVDELCDQNADCVSSGYNFFTESGSYTSGPFLPGETCSGNFADMCDSSLDIDYAPCAADVGDAVCTEDPDGDTGVRLPEACKWMTGDLG